MPPPNTVDGFIAAAQSKATKRAYANDVQHYLRHGGAIPSTGPMVAAYLANFAGTLKVATLERRCIAIHNAHISQALASPVKGNALVKATMNGIRRTMGTRQRAVKPVTKDVLLEMLVTLDKQKPLKAARDKALLLVGFAGAFRRSELVALHVEDLSVDDAGAMALLRFSKTDQLGKGRTVFLPRASDAERCPVQSLLNWLELAGVRSGWLFRSVRKGGGSVSDKPLSTQSVAEIIKRATKAAGRDFAEFSGHSLRAGYVTTAAIVGLQPYQIREQTGHKSDATLARYIRPVEKRKIVALAPTGNGGPVDDGFNAASQPRCCFRLVLNNGGDNADDIVRLNVTDCVLTNDGKGVLRQGVEPLLGVFGALPRRLGKFDEFYGAGFEGLGLGQL
jgi:integrase